MFSEYLEPLIKIKQSSSDPVKRLLAKLQQNSLYGKFGQKKIRENYVLTICRCDTKKHLEKVY
jgi:hypothetical protein